MRTILLGIIIVLMNFSAFECDAQTSRLPKEMPENVEIHFNRGGGMRYAYTKIEIANQTIKIEEKNGDEKTPRKWSAKITREEQENLYKLFVEKKFDTIKNDKREGIVYDAGSEGISINAGTGAFYNISYGLNSPMSGDNLKRYKAIADAIHALRSRYEGKAQKTSDTDFAIFDYTAENFGWKFKNAQAIKLSGDEIAEVKNLTKKAVAEYNSKQKKSEWEIKLDTYRFQFLPVINENGEKEVWVNSFCTDFPNWQTQIVSVTDGGNCFFNLYVNLTKNSYDRFYVNGEA